MKSLGISINNSNFINCTNSLPQAIKYKIAACILLFDLKVQSVLN